MRWLYSAYKSSNRTTSSNSPPNMKPTGEAGGMQSSTSAMEHVSTSDLPSAANLPPTWKSAIRFWHEGHRVPRPIAERSLCHIAKLPEVSKTYMSPDDERALQFTASYCTFLTKRCRATTHVLSHDASSLLGNSHNSMGLKHLLVRICSSCNTSGEET